jgi:peptidoglycan/xylan/chitin deacetylase (PgdA/CDA1 family)
MEEAAGSGRTTLSNGIPAIAFEADAPQGASAMWNLSSPLEAGWHTVEIEFGPETNTRKLIDFECLDAGGNPVLSVNLYHAPSKAGGAPFCRFGIHLSRPAAAIRWRKNQTRNMRSAPLVGLSVRGGRPASGSAFLEALALVVEPDQLRFPADLGGGHLRVLTDRPVSLRWTQAGGGSFVTPPAAETTAFLSGSLVDVRPVSGAPQRALLERRFESPSPVVSAGLEGPVIPLFGDPRRQYVIEVVGSDLDPATVSLADFPGGARMAAVQSWDDGIPQDQRAAELLHRFGWRASFFFNRNSRMVDRWKELEELGMEVGSHSWSHPFYPLQSPRRCRDESVLMRRFLESKTGHPVISFAYPFNYGAAFDAEGDYVLRAQREAGYVSCRTTMNGPLSLEDLGDPLILKTSAHFLAGRDRIEAEWRRAANARRGVFYLWGHTYEIVTETDWVAFEEMLRTYGRRPGVWYAAQGDLMFWKLLRDGTRVTASGDAQRLVVRVDAAAPHSWWAARVPLAIRVPGRVTQATAGGKALPVVDGEVQVHPAGWDVARSSSALAPPAKTSTESVGSGPLDLPEARPPR